MNNSPITYCKKCLYPSNHPLRLSFNNQGVCSGCLVHEEKDNYEWGDALCELTNIASAYRSQNAFDCIIPVSGGRDSYYIVHFVKHILKLNPLLVAYNRHYNTALGIRNLEQLRTRLGCDIVMSTPSPSRVKTITQQTLRLFGSIHWAYLAGSSVFPVQVAVKRKIPLIIWGAHQGVDQVGMFFHKDKIEMTRRYRKEHDLLGFEAEDLVDKAPGLTENLLSPLFYPEDKELNKFNIRGIYLNNYIFWDSKKQHESMINTYGYEPYKLSRTFDSYNDIDCQYYTDVHDLIKYIKFGYSKVMDHACRELRLDRLNRDQALKLNHYFSSKPVTNLSRLTSWLEISEKQFYDYLAPFRDLRVWRNQHGNWILNDDKSEKIVYSEEEINEILNMLKFKSSHSDEVKTLITSPQLLTRGYATMFHPKAKNEELENLCNR